MKHLFAALAAIALVALAPAARAAPVAPGELIQSLADDELAYAKRGGKSWKGGKGWKKAKWRGGPPYWAPAHGLRRKRGW
jgi:hypothetical protein